ncbi:MAG: (Fe-S)-binding protein [Euryarchaeota archaeon]|nr:(Fe-S)-binding protein [Euryarchaeota archaeon]
MNRELLACLQCGYCMRVCPSYEQTPWESITPRGKVYYLAQLSNRSPMDAILRRGVEIDDEFVESVYKCTGCAQCETVCHVNIEFADFWEKVREWLVDMGKGPMPAHTRLYERIKNTKNPYGEPAEKRGAWWPEEIPHSPQADVVFFAGCTASYRMQRIARAGAMVLHRAGVKLDIMGGEEWCCTSPALRTGQTGLTTEFAMHNIREVEIRGGKSWVMTCAGCFKTSSHDYGKFYSNPTFPVYHFTQYMLKLINERKFRLTKKMDLKVTYHDPCHLGRHGGVFEEPRELLSKIPGVELVEMPRNRMNSRCCGAGGGYKSAFNDLAVNIAAERVKEAVATGADILVTTCPFCVLNLEAGAQQIGSDIKVMDISELLLEATEPEDVKASAAAAGKAKA